VLGAPRPIEFPDEKQYLNIADNFIRGNGLAVTVDSRTDQMLYYPQEIQRPPMYPLMLAIFLKLKLGLTGVKVAQALMGALLCLMVYVLSRELAGEWPARIAGLIAAVDPFSIYFTGLILSETLFLLLFVTSWYYIVRTWREIGSREPTTHWVASALVAGLLGAGAVLTRSEVLPVYLLVPVVWLLAGPRRLVGFAVGAGMLLVLCVGLSPWIARNYMRTSTKDEPGHLVVTTLKVGESLFEAVGPFATGGPNKENTVWPPQAEALLSDEYARNQYLLDKSLVYMQEDPGRTLKLAGRKFLRTWNIFPNYEGVRTRFNMIVSASAFIPTLACALVGLVVSLRRREVLWLLLPIVVMTLLHVVFVGSVRYRLSMMPFVMTLSGVGVWWIVSPLLRRKAAPAAPDAKSET
jgi:4-amino-4-deoxy-L-arabinose transferase-like glycosyltransferase